MASINPYLNFNGNAEKAFTFYKSVFGGEFTAFQRFKDVPQEEQKNFRPEEAEKVMHVALPIGKGNVLMASDSPDAFGPAKQGTNFYISIQADSKEEAEKLFNALSRAAPCKCRLPTPFGEPTLACLSTNSACSGW